MNGGLYSILVISYAISCIACSFAPRAGLLCLLCVAAVISFPYFAVQASKRFLAGMVISTALLILSILVPIFAVIPLLWGVISIFLKAGRFLKNAPLMIAGILLYVVVAFVPHAALQLIPPHLPFWSALSLRVFVPLLMGLLGYLAIRALVFLFTNFGYTDAHSVAVMLGFTSYLFIFFLMLLIPIDADVGDADGFDWDD